MTEHAAEPREPGPVAFGLMRLLPSHAQSDPQVASAVASIVGVIYKLAGFGAS